MPASTRISPAQGPLLLLLPGLGAVATTFIAGVEAIRQGKHQAIGSLTQMQTIRLGPRSHNVAPPIREVVPLAALDDLRFAAWDPIPDNAYQAAQQAGVLSSADLEPHRDFLEGIEPMPAAFEQRFVQRLDGPNVKTETNRLDLANALRQDIRDRKQAVGAERAVMVWCGSTEIYCRPKAAHASLEAFESALAANDETISPSQLYAYAALKEGVPYANGAPNLSADIPALEQLALEQGVAIAGKDFKTGQTLIKTVLAPAFKARMLGIRGWFSTNILGNRDGDILEDPQSFHAKEVTKTGSLEHILQADLYPDLYGDIYHKVRINYYPPRGDAKEGWDNIDLFGWLGYPLQLKVNFLCRDSILAAPIVLDLALFLDLSQRAGKSGIQDWLSFYFKSPHVHEGAVPEHDLFIQHMRLKNALRIMSGHEPINHLSK